MKTARLQIALAKELPGLLVHARGFVRWAEGEQKRVTDREWDWIVRECIQKLSKEQFRRCVYNMLATNGYPQRITWQQRAIAYFSTIEKAIE
jgi:hypothetical protein